MMRTASNSGKALLKRTAENKILILVSAHVLSCEEVDIQINSVTLRIRAIQADENEYH